MAEETRVPVTRSIPAALKELETNSGRDGWVLSAYIDTSPARTMGSGYLLALRDNAKKLREVLEKSADANVDDFERAVGAVESYFAEPFAPPALGVAVFAGASGLQLAAPIPCYVEDQVHWAPTPVTTPLRQALDDFERVAVLLIDKERTRFFTIVLGDIEERAHFTDLVPGKQATGGWFGLSQKRYARHHENEVLRHAKRTIELVQNELNDHPFDRLLIGGPDEAVSVLRRHLPRRVEARVAGTINAELFASEADVLRAATDVMEQAERRQELADIEELVSNRTSYAVVGLENTLQALFEGRVDRLFATSTLPARIRRCVDCGRLTSLQPCPVCMGETNPGSEMPEPAVESAIEQGARVEIVSGAAADLLSTAGGLGAWCRRSER